MRRESATILDTWHTLGMRGTGYLIASYDQAYKMFNGGIGDRLAFARIKPPARSATRGVCLFKDPSLDDHSDNAVRPRAECQSWPPLGLAPHPIWRSRNATHCRTESCSRS